jgi:glycosyl hydrolase family 42 (putative beta-galactosidase)
VSNSRSSHTFHGIYGWLQAINPVGLHLELTNRNVDGMSFWTRWNIIEPEQGVFDWSSLDAHVRAATGAGKHFVLSVVAGMDTPHWVYGLGASAVRLSRGTVPIPWDPTYLQYFKRMIAQLGAHYANNPALDGVHITGINYGSGETFLVAGPSAADCRPWMEAGYSASRVISAYSQILNEFTDDFPRVQFSPSIIPGGFCLNANTLDFSMNGTLISLGGSVPENSGWKNHWIMSGMTGYQEGSPLGRALPAALKLVLAQPTTRYLELYQGDLDNAVLAPKIAAARRLLLSR